MPEIHNLSFLNPKLANLEPYLDQKEYHQDRQGSEKAKFESIYTLAIL